MVLFCTRSLRALVDSAKRALARGSYCASTAAERLSGLQQHPRPGWHKYCISGRHGHPGLSSLKHQSSTTACAFPMPGFVGDLRLDAIVNVRAGP